MPEKVSHDALPQTSLELSVSPFNPFDELVDKVENSMLLHRMSDSPATKNPANSDGVEHLRRAANSQARTVKFSADSSGLPFKIAKRPPLSALPQPLSAPLAFKKRRPFVSR